MIGYKVKIATEFNMSYYHAPSDTIYLCEALTPDVAEEVAKIIVHETLHAVLYHVFGLKDRRAQETAVGLIEEELERLEGS